MSGNTNVRKVSETRYAVENGDERVVSRTDPNVTDDHDWKPSYPQQGFRVGAGYQWQSVAVQASFYLAQGHNFPEGPPSTRKGSISLSYEF